MDFKRIEIYVGWTCNQKCTYCMEFPNMERQWTKRVSKYDILKNLIKYREKGYNHVTLLGGEPFIQPVFLDALRLGKKMGYTILVTTNATTLHLENEAKKYLPYIDELILSVQAIDRKLQQKISRTNVYVEWDKVFDNINKYWKGSYFKVNVVITKDNLKYLFDLVEYSYNKGVRDIAITYPDLDLEYYGINHLSERVAPTYKESILEIEKIYDYYNKKQLNLKIVDFPFCIFSSKNRNVFIKMTDEFDYSNRIKVSDVLYEDNKIFYNEISRLDVLPRERQLIEKCIKCIYNKMCWGPSKAYKELYGYDIIKSIK